MMERQAPTYAQLHKNFKWDMPSTFNLGVACVDRHRPDALGLIEVKPDGRRRDYTFGELSELSNRLANALRAQGIGRGDRVALLLSQRVEVGLAHIAVYKIGAIAVPLSSLFGPDAVRHRLRSSGAAMIITEPDHAETVVLAGDDDLRVVLVEPGPIEHTDFWTLVRDGSSTLEPVVTMPEDPALLVYTSGTTGVAKGALHAHRVLLGHLPGFELSHDFFPKDGDLFWTPADWAWIGGLMDALLPTWYHGRPIVAAARTRFDPEWAIQLMGGLGVRNAFLPPTALKLLRKAEVSTAGVALRSVMSGGEPLGSELLAWGQEHLGLTINEIYGQTEANYTTGGCSVVWEPRPGSMGRPYPGHVVDVVGPDGLPLPNGEVGEVAVGVPDPVVFLRYWNDPEATQGKFSPSRDRLLTGDLAAYDGDGYLWFKSRADDVINSAGYRIGPNEIEACLMAHPAVAMAAAIGVRDQIRGEVVKAFVVLSSGYKQSDELVDQLQGVVRYRLAAYLYPREIEFVQELPLTATGKILRSELRRAEAARLSRSPSNDDRPEGGNTWSASA